MMVMLWENSIIPSDPIRGYIYVISSFIKRFKPSMFSLCSWKSVISYMKESGYKVSLSFSYVSSWILYWHKYLKRKYIVFTFRVPILTTSFISGASSECLQNCRSCRKRLIINGKNLQWSFEQFIKGRNYVYSRVIRFVSVFLNA